MFEISLASPPNRDELVAEILLRHAESVDQPAEVFREAGQLMVALYPRPDGEPWEFPLAEFRSALEHAVRRLEA